MRYRIYGVFLLALGLLTLILGLMPPRTTDVIIVGGAVIIAGLLEFTLARGRTPPRIPASCKKEAQKALELRRTIDWEKLKTTIRFEDAGITICAEENEEHLSYTRISKSNELTRQLRQAKLDKEELMAAEGDATAQRTQELIALLEDGPDFLDHPDTELCGALIAEIIVESNDTLRFRLHNGLELRESIERTVR